MTSVLISKTYTSTSLPNLEPDDTNNAQAESGDVRE